MTDKLPDQPQDGLEKCAGIHRDVLIASAVVKGMIDHSAPAPKPSWLEFVNSSAVTTLITVILGGIAGQILISNFQEHQKLHEMAQQEFGQYIQKRQGVMQNALDAVGGARVDAETLIQLAQPRNDPRYTPDAVERKRGSVLRQKYLDDHMELLKKWDVDRGQLALLLNYYYDGNQDIQSAWEKTTDTATDLLNCSQSVYLNSLSGQAPPEAPCKHESDFLDSSLSNLSNAFQHSRAYSWRSSNP